MRKLFSALILGLVTVTVMPSCSTSDSLEEVIEESTLDVASSTDDKEVVIAKPGGGN